MARNAAFDKTVKKDRFGSVQLLISCYIFERNLIKRHFLAKLGETSYFIEMKSPAKGGPFDGNILGKLGLACRHSVKRIIRN